MAHENHRYTEGENVSVANGMLHIETRKEHGKGLAWDTKFGFIEKEFDFTSGIVSTANSFRQKQGKFQAKIRYSNTNGVYHAFWLVGDKMLPELDILRKRGDKQNVQGAYFWASEANKSPKKSIAEVGVDLSKDYYILSIEWDKEKITWFVNGVAFKEQTNNLPDSSLYVVLSSGVTNTVDINSLPATMEIDWVRCWQRASHQ